MAQKQDVISAGDIALWRLAGVMAVALYLAPEKTPVWVCMGLICMAALATHPVLSTPWVKRKQKAARSAVAMFIMFLLVGGYGWLVWPPKRYYIILTENKRQEFMGVLRSQTAPKETLVVQCSASSEELCALATEYLEMFQRAGWKTPTGGIERGFYLKSFPGISIGKKPAPGNVDPNDPVHGLWILQSPSIATIMKAFQSVGITPAEMANQNLPDNTISIYFGPEPKPK